jgi:hypothetical protein
LLPLASYGAFEGLNRLSGAAINGFKPKPELPTFHLVEHLHK